MPRTILNALAKKKSHSEGRVKSLFGSGQDALVSTLIGVAG